MRILVTGGSGSLGTALVRRLIADGAERVVALGRDEAKLAELAESVGKAAALQCFLGDVREPERMREAMWRVDAVVHCAALKRVDLIAADPEEAIRTNVDGTVNVVKAAIGAGVERVLVISSDKATPPAITFYGQTKALAESFSVRANARGFIRDARAKERAPQGTRVACIRYGNVADSRGAVLHLFRRRVAEGKPIPITDPRCTRFFLTMAQAVDVVLEALDLLRGGEIFVPDLPAGRVVDLAEAVGGAGYPTEVIGMRPGGEKLHEALVGVDESVRAVQVTTEYWRWWVIEPALPMSWRRPWLGAACQEVRSDTARQMTVDELRAMVGG